VLGTFITAIGAVVGSDVVDVKQFRTVYEGALERYSGPLADEEPSEFAA